MGVAVVGPNLGPVRWQGLGAPFDSEASKIAGLPARTTGLTMVASMACWEACQSGSPLATTSSGGRLRPAHRCSCPPDAHCVPPERRLLVGRARLPVRGAEHGRQARPRLRSPVVSSVSRQPRQAHACGPTGSDSCRRRDNIAQNCGEETAGTREVGETVRARAACGPVCNKSSARDAASR